MTAGGLGIIQAQACTNIHLIPAVGILSSPQMVSLSNHKRGSYLGNLSFPRISCLPTCPLKLSASGSARLNDIVGQDFGTQELYNNSRLYRSSTSQSVELWLKLLNYFIFHFLLTHTS